MSRNPLHLAARLPGSLYCLAQAMGAPLGQAPQALQRVFKAGLFDMPTVRHALTDLLPPGWPWPDDAMRICAASRKNSLVVIGGSDGPNVSMWKAVAASCAIPFLYAPQRAELVSSDQGPPRHLVLQDGGLASGTNVAVAIAEGCDLIVVSSMAPTRSNRPALYNRLMAEVDAAQQAGIPVVVVNPPEGLATRRVWKMLSEQLCMPAYAAGFDDATRVLDMPETVRQAHRRDHSVSRRGRTGRPRRAPG